MKSVPVYLTAHKLDLVREALASWLVVAPYLPLKDEQYSRKREDMKTILEQIKEELDTFKEGDTPDYEKGEETSENEINYKWSSDGL